MDAPIHAMETRERRDARETMETTGTRETDSSKAQLAVTAVLTEDRVDLDKLFAELEVLRKKWNRFDTPASSSAAKSSSSSSSSSAVPSSSRKRLVPKGFNPFVGDENADGYDQVSFSP
jgi:hypothetical protein